MKNLLLLSLLIFTTTTLFSQLSREVGFFGQSFYDKGTKVSKQQIGTILKEVDLASYLWETARKNEKLSYILSGVTVGTILYTTISKEDSDTDLLVAIGGLGTAIAAFVYSLNANKSYNLAIRTYNEALGKGKIGFQPKLYISPNKVGLIANF